MYEGWGGKEGAFVLDLTRSKVVQMPEHQGCSARAIPVLESTVWALNTYGPIGLSGAVSGAVCVCVCVLYFVCLIMLVLVTT